MSLKQKLVNGAFAFGGLVSALGVADIAYNVYEFNKAKDEAVRYLNQPVVFDGKNRNYIDSRPEGSLELSEIDSLQVKYANRSSLGMGAICLGALIITGAILAHPDSKRLGEAC